MKNSQRYCVRRTLVRRLIIKERGEEGTAENVKEEGDKEKEKYEKAAVQ